MSNRALTKTLTYGVITRIGSPLCAATSAGGTMATDASVTVSRVDLLLLLLHGGRACATTWWRA